MSSDDHEGEALGTRVRGALAAPRPELRVLIARGLLLTASLPITLLGAAGLVAHPTAFAWSDPTLFAVPVASLLLLLLGFVASFAPFDRPQSTPRWTRPLVGYLGGVAVGGLCLFTSSFVVLGPVALVLALLLHVGARAVAAGPPDLELPTTSMSLEELEELADPPLDWRVWAPISGGLILGLVTCVLWLPVTAEVAVSRPGEGVAAVISRSLKPESHGRVVRNANVLEVKGHDLKLQVSLERPRLLLRLRDQDLVIEPCLLLEEGSVDGLPVIWELNGIRLEPGGPALVDFTEGRSRVWIRVAYSQGRERRGALAAQTAFLGRRAAANAISATLEIEVDLDWGRVVIDSRTRLYRSAAASKATLGWIRLRDAPHVPCRIAFGDGINYLPDRVTEEVNRSQRFFSCDRAQTRLLRAKRGQAGPYETLSVGDFGDWFVLPSQRSQTLIVVPDWQRLASRRTSRSAGFGLAENSFRLWHEGGGVNALFDVASGRYGEGFLPSALPAGLYRNRIVIHPLRREDPAQVADEILAGFARAEAEGLMIEKDSSQAPGEEGSPSFEPGGPKLFTPR